MTWKVTGDGSALTQNRPKGQRHPGGWAAVIEHGCDGWVERGAVQDTTSTRMELFAAIMGLRQVPAGEPAVLVSDCTVVWSVHDRWQRRALPGWCRDIDLWRDLAAEFDRLGPVKIRDERSAVHKRCHAIAQAEARKLGAELGLTPTVLSTEEQRRRAAARLERKARRERRELHRLERLPLLFRTVAEAIEHVPQAYLTDIPHRKHCGPTACVRECIHYGTAGR